MDELTGSTGGTSRPVIVGVDGSDASVEALRYARMLREALNTDLIAITAWHYPATHGGYLSSDWSPKNQAVQTLQEALDLAFHGSPPPRLRTEVIEGTAARVLLDAAADAQMLVVGCRGSGGFERLLLGSVSSACAEYAKCPVLVCHTPASGH